MWDIEYKLIVIPTNPRIKLVLKLKLKFKLNSSKSVSREKINF